MVAMSTSPIHLTLDQLLVGETATIIEVNGDDAVAVRLMEMGLTDDEPIKMIGKAPLGDPLEFEIRGYRVSLRSTEAKRVQIARTA